MKRLLAALLIATLFTAPAYADDASLLGPSSGSGSASSTGTSTSLQPANPGSPQAGNDGFTSGTGQASGDAQTNLQPVGGAAAYKLFVSGGSDADGDRQELSDSPSPWLWAGLGATLLVIIAAGVNLMRRRSTDPVLVGPEPVGSVEPPLNPKKVKKSPKKRKAAKRKR